MPDTWLSFRTVALGLALALGACAAPAAPPATPLPTAAPSALPEVRPTAVPSALPAVTPTTTPADPALLASSITLYNPKGLTFDASGNLYVSECGGDVFKVDPFDLISGYAGVEEHGFSGDGGPALSAQLDCPIGIRFDQTGSLYIADRNNNRIRRIDPAGIITTIAGTGEEGFSGDGGLALAAAFAGPGGLAVGPDGSIYVADTRNNRIRRIDRQGIVTTIAGTGTPGFSGDGGPANAAQLRLWYSDRWIDESMVFDSGGNLYFADNGNDRVRRIDPRGIITTIAGAGDQGAFGDGGPATAAALPFPQGLALDAEGSLYITCGASQLLTDSRVRKLDRNGIITTVAGTGVLGFAGDGGPATLAQLRYPTAIAFGPQGDLYIVDEGNSRVRKVDGNGTITTVAGGGFQ